MMRRAKGRRSAAVAALVATLVARAPLHAQETGRDAIAGFTVLRSDTREPRLDRLVTLTFSGSLREAIVRLAALANLSIVYDDSLPGLDARTNLRADGATVRSVLLRALDASPLQALVSPT